jgi:peptidyl-prolyl cis-trans isomerase D
MLQAIHDNLKGVFAMIILGALAVVFVFWGVEFVSVGGLTASQGIEVNGQDVNTTEIRQAYQEEITRYQAAFGAADVPTELREKIRQDVLEGAIRQELIRQRTDEQRFRASNADVLETLKEIPAFQVDGKFSKDAYYAALRSANLEPAVFEAQQKHFVAARQLDRGIYASAIVLPQEYTRRVALVNETREVAWVVVPAASFMGEASPDEAAIADYYARNKANYQTEESANLQYVELSLADLSADVTVTEDALRAFYEDNLDRYTSIERRRASHILITSTGDDAADEAKARAAYDRAVAGEDFARLAAELSQDPGSAQQGGDLGWAERGNFVAPFADAVWSLKPGDISAPVRTEFGWHVIKLDGVEAGEVRSFEEVRGEIEPEYRRFESERLFGDLQDQLDTDAFEAGGDLQRVAEALALEIRSQDGFTRAGGGALGSPAALVNAVFEPDVLSGSQLRTVELAPGRVVAIKVVAHEPPREKPLDEVRAEVVAALVGEASSQAAARRAEALVGELRAGAEWGSLAKPWIPAEATDPTSAVLRFINRNEAAVPAEIVASTFQAGEPAGKPLYGATALASGDTAVWTVTYVKPGSVAPLSPAQRAQAMREARDRASFQDASVYVTALRSKAEVKVNPQLFE